MTHKAVPPNNDKKAGGYLDKIYSHMKEFVQDCRKDFPSATIFGMKNQRISEKKIEDQYTNAITFGKKIRDGNSFIDFKNESYRTFDISDEVLKNIPASYQKLIYAVTIEKSPPDALIHLIKQLESKHLSAEQFTLILHYEMEFIAQYQFFIDLLNERHAIEKFLKLKRILPYSVTGRREKHLNAMIADCLKRKNNFEVKMNEIEKSYEGSKSHAKSQKLFYKKLDTLLTNDEAFKKYCLREIYRNPITFNEIHHFFKRFISRPICRKSQIKTKRLYPEIRDQINTLKKM